MSKPLSEQTLEELWQLFPIRLVEPQTDWAIWYMEEEAFLKSILPDKINIWHVGSTSISGIWAKPTVDILMESDMCEFERTKNLLLDNGYICMSQGSNRLDFNKGYTPEGFADRVFHLHLREFGDNDELYFRDYLREHGEIAKAYEELKLSLWKPYEHNRDGYTDSKSTFVHEYTKKAKLKYANKYRIVNQ